METASETSEFHSIWRLVVARDDFNEFSRRGKFTFPYISCIFSNGTMCSI